MGRILVFFIAYARWLRGVLSGQNPVVCHGVLGSGLALGFISLILCFVLLIPHGFAQTSANVPVNHPVYRFIDNLVAQGFVKKIVLSQKPYSRLEVARILKEGRKQVDEDYEERWIDYDYFQALFEHFEKEFKSDFEK